MLSTDVLVDDEQMKVFIHSSAVALAPWLPTQSQMHSLLVFSHLLLYEMCLLFVQALT